MDPDRIPVSNIYAWVSLPLPVLGSLIPIGLIRIAVAFDWPEIYSEEAWWAGLSVGGILFFGFLLVSCLAGLFLAVLSLRRSDRVSILGSLAVISNGMIFLCALALLIVAAVAAP
jgi:hypothetical protein